MKSSRRQWVDYHVTRKDSLALKKRNLGCTVIDLVMKIKPFKGVNTKAWHFLLKKEQQFSFFMFNCITSDKSVTYKTEILCACWSSCRAGRKNTWLGIMPATDRTQRGLFFMTPSQIFSALAPPNSVNEHFITWPLIDENFNLNRTW